MDQNVYECHLCTFKVSSCSEPTALPTTYRLLTAVSIKYVFYWDMGPRRFIDLPLFRKNLVPYIKKISFTVMNKSSGSSFRISIPKLHGVRSQITEILTLNLLSERPVENTICSYLFQHCFAISYRRENQRQYELRASTESDCKTWIEAIREAR
jgi:hypothetical protein